MTPNYVIRWIGFLAAACASGLAVAQESRDQESASGGLRIGALRVRPTVGLSVGYDDNVLQTANSEVSSIVTRLSPGVRLEGGNERNRLSVSLASELVRFQDSSRDNAADTTLSAEWSYNPVLRHAVNVTAEHERGHDDRGTASREGDLARLPLDPDEYHRNELRAGYRFGAPGARGRVEVEALTSDIEYQNNRQYTASRDRQDQGVAAAFYLRVAPKTAAVLRAEQRDVEYDTASLDSTETHYYAGIELDATAKTSGMILLGRVEKDFDDPTRNDFSGASWRAGLRFKPRTYSVIELTSGRETDETNGFGDFILRRDVTLGWSHQWSSRLSTQADIGVADEEHRPSFRRDDTTFYGLSSQFSLSPWLRLGAGLRNYDRDSDIPELNYGRRTMLVSLEASL